jgi:stage II sporulation protein D
MTATLKRCTLILAALLILLLAPPQARAADIRILLESATTNAFSVYINSGDYELQDERGRYIADIRRGAKVDVKYNRDGFSAYADGKLAADKLPGLNLIAADAGCLFEYNGKLYRGSLYIVANGASLYIINTLDLEYYLYGVVGREMGYNQPLEALKAQAVASRSYAVAKMDSASKYYDLGSGTSAQSYGGYTAEKEAVNANVISAVNATAGEIVCYRGKPFECNYHSNAGGHTEDAANVWGGNSPLKGMPSPYDDYVEKSSPNSSIYRWQVTYSAAQLRDLAERYAGRSIGEYRGIELSTTDANGRPSASGRVMEVIITGNRGQVSAKREEIRALLGNLKSTLFNLSDTGNTITVSSNTTFYVLDKGQTTPQPIADLGACYVRTGIGGALSRLADWGLNFVIKGAQQTVIVGNGSVAASTSSSSGSVTLYGKGYGHGVGMSQWGAAGMAAEGYTYEEILSHYYNIKDNRDFSLSVNR